MNNHGFVYLLKNPSMPGLYKIGFTTKTVEERVSQLSKSTGVPENFEVLYYSEFGRVISAYAMEQALHKTFRHRRIADKEFFRFNSDSDAIFKFIAAVCDYLSFMFLETDSGYAWLEKNTTSPNEIAFVYVVSNIYEKESADVARNAALSCLQSAYISKNSLEHFGILRSFCQETIGDAIVSMIGLGYAVSPEDAAYMFMSKNHFLKAWMSKLCERALNELSADVENAKKEYETKVIH